MLKKIIFLSVLCLTTSTFAAAPSNLHEVEMSITESTLSVGGAATFNIGVGYNYGLTDMFQVGGRMTFTTVGGASAFTLLGGGTINLNITNPGGRIVYSDALFIQAYVGFTAGTTTAFTFEGTVGKRFAVLKNLSYTPELGVLVAGGAAFIARPLQFSALF